MRRESSSSLHRKSAKMQKQHSSVLHSVNLSSEKTYMDTPLPSMTTEDFTVDKPVQVNITVMSDETTAGQHVKDKKSKGFFKRAWKAVKRPFSHGSHKTKVEAIVPDTSVPCVSGLQRKASVGGPSQPPTTALPLKRARSDDDNDNLDVVSITSNDWTVSENIQQDSEMPADASPENVENIPQEQHVKGKKSKGFFKRAWKAVKRPFHRRSHKTKMETIVLDTSVPCVSGLQRKADREPIRSPLSSVGGPSQPSATALPPKEAKRVYDDLEVVSITSSDWIVCDNIQQEVESVGLKDEIKPEQEQHDKEKKRKSGIFRTAWKAVKRPFRHQCRQTETKQDQRAKKEKKKPNGGFFKRTWEATNSLRRRSRMRVNFFFMRCRRRFRKRAHQHYRNHRCPHHHCCAHRHNCPFCQEHIVLCVREQIMSTLPSVSGPSNYPQQFCDEPMVEERQQRVPMFRRLRCKIRVKRRTQEHAKEEKMKRNGSVFKRTWKAVKRPFRCCQTRVEPIVSDTPVPCSTGLQKTADGEQIRSERPSVSVPNEENKPQEQQAKETRKRTPLFLPPIFQPSEEMFRSLYNMEYEILGKERFGEVLLATRNSDGKKVAVKQVSRAYWSASPYAIAGYMDQVVTEVAMMSLLKQPPISPYVIQMFEWFHEEFRTYIVMEDPGSCTVLGKIIKLHPLDEKIAQVVMRQAVQAAQHCIAHGVFHYYISSCNILINTSNLDIKLIDFGYSVPYTGKKYHRPAGETVPLEYDYSAITANVMQLGRLLKNMVYGPFERQGPYVPKNIPAISRACRSLIDWCTHLDQSKRPTLEQILQHRWFSQELRPVASVTYTV